VEYADYRGGPATLRQVDRASGSGRPTVSGGREFATQPSALRPAAATKNAAHPELGPLNVSPIMAVCNQRDVL
jgi:hypothetical protein